MTLFERVKETAKKRGYTLAELARRAGIGEKSIYTWKPSKTYPNGVTPSREVLERVANQLDVSVNFLLTGEETDNIVPKSDDRPTLQKIARRATKLDDKQLEKLDEVMSAIFKETFGDDDK